MTFQALKFTHSIARRPFLLFIEVADARGVRAVTSGPLYRFLLGFECRKNVIGMSSTTKSVIGLPSDRETIGQGS